MEISSLTADSLGWEAWATLAVLLAMVVALVRGIARTDYVLLGSLGLLLVAGIVTPQEAFAGFANPAVLTIGSLFVVAEAVHKTNALKALMPLFFPRTNRLGRMLPSFMLSTAGLSAFLNNTPVVAMLIPRVKSWAESASISPSKVFIPLSYAAILGGLITLIGTSTNIVVSGLMEAEGYAPLGFFDLTTVGLPAAVVVIIFFVAGGHRLLPDNATDEDTARMKDYFFEVRVAERSPFVGQTIEEAGLRHLGNAYLVNLYRQTHRQPAHPTEVLVGGDVLSFIGSADAVEGLLSREGLTNTVNEHEPGDGLEFGLYEAVVAPGSQLVGKTLREVDFRSTFGGVVLAIRRRDEEIRGSLGRVPIKEGDLLLIEARPRFYYLWRDDRDEFYLVSQLREAQATARSRKAPAAIAVLFGMVAAVVTGLLPLATAAFAAALGVIVLKCLLGREAQAAVDVKVLIVIAAALGIGAAVEKTGLAGFFAHGMVAGLAPLGTVAVMLGLYITTNILTELITHKAAAVLMLPVAIAAAIDTGAEPKAFALVVAVAAAASFMTPIGYQTNLMVMSVGRYRFSDYLRVGVPVSLLVMAVAVAMIRLVWMG